MYRNRGKLLLYNLAIILLTIGVILVWPREYRSEAKLWIKIGRENSRLDPTASTGETISIQETDREDEIKSVIDIMGSRGVVEGTVDVLGPEVVLGDEPLPGSDEEPKKNVLVDAFKSTFGSLLKTVKQIDPISSRRTAASTASTSIRLYQTSGTPQPRACRRPTSTHPPPSNGSPDRVYDAFVYYSSKISSPGIGL